MKGGKRFKLLIVLISDLIVMKIKTVFIGIGLFVLLAGSLIYLARRPAYKIQTSGKLYIVNKLSSSLTVFDLFLGKELATIPIDIEPHEITALMSGSKIVLTNYGNIQKAGKKITVIDANNYTIEKSIDLKESLKPHGIASIPGSSEVAVVTDLSNELLVIDIESGKIKKKISTEQQYSHIVVLHPIEPIAYVTNLNSNSVSVIDLNLDKVVKILPCGPGTEGIDITPDGSEIWVSNSKENSIYIFNTESFQRTKVLSTGIEPSRLKFTNNGNFCLVTNARSGSIFVYDRYGKKCIKIIRLPGKEGIIERILYHTPRPVGMLMHPTDPFAFVANSNADQVAVIDLNNFEVVSTIGTQRVPDGLAWSE